MYNQINPFRMYFFRENVHIRKHKVKQIITGGVYQCHCEQSIIHVTKKSELLGPLRDVKAVSNSCMYEPAGHFFNGTLQDFESHIVSCWLFVMIPVTVLLIVTNFQLYFFFHKRDIHDHLFRETCLARYSYYETTRYQNRTMQQKVPMLRCNNR